MDLVGSEHVKSHQVDDGLLPSVRLRVVQVLNSLLVVILYFVQSALMSHVSLPNDERHGVHL